jgi:succinoglycan biosynthesis transport protein ExoP
MIVGRVSLQDAIWTDPSTSLTFLPASNKTRVVNSSEVLAADATRALFKDLRAKYDYVLVDLSPLVPVVDTRATTGFVDSYVFVTEWGRTKVVRRETFVQRCSERLSEPSWVVLNRRTWIG